MGTTKPEDEGIYRIFFPSFNWFSGNYVPPKILIIFDEEIFVNNENIKEIKGKLTEEGKRIILHGEMPAN